MKKEKGKEKKEKESTNFSYFLLQRATGDEHRPAARSSQSEKGAGADQSEARLLHAQHQDLLEPRAEEGARAAQGRERQIRAHERPAQASQLGESGTVPTWAGRPILSSYWRKVQTC